MIPPVSMNPIHPTTAITTTTINRGLPINNGTHLRAGINYPVRTLPSVKPLTTPNYPPQPLTSLPLQLPSYQTTLRNEPYIPKSDIITPLNSIYDSIIKNETYNNHPVSNIPTKI